MKYFIALNIAFKECEKGKMDNCNFIKARLIIKRV